jgi:hypothetical protein
LDVGDLWQENKRFVQGLAAAALVFVVGLLSIRTAFGDELRSERARRSRLERELEEARFGAAEREEARAENRALRESLARIAEGVVFRPREDFTIPPEETSHVNRYHRTIAAVRERLLQKAGRAGLFVDRDLGLPDLSPARAESAERYLSGLDCVERAVEIALATGVERIGDIRIRLDPALASREGPKKVERTRVELALEGSGLALSSFLERTQRSSVGPLVVEEAELLPARGRRQTARLVIDFALVRLHVGDELLGDASPAGEEGGT